MTICCESCQKLLYGSLELILAIGDDMKLNSDFSSSVGTRNQCSKNTVAVMLSEVLGFCVGKWSGSEDGVGMVLLQCLESKV